MAPPVDPPTTITLRIKVPPGHIPGIADEFTLGNDIAVSLKIGQIRERIQEAIPTSPTPERQRLLYGGRALVDNDQTVADALNIRRDPTQNEYVVHLLVKGNGDATAPIPHRTGLHTPNRSGSPAAIPNPPGAPQLPPQQAVNPNVGSPIHLQQPQGQAQTFPTGHPALRPPEHAHAVPLEHLQQHQAAVLAQQQRLQAQMLQNANQRALHTGLVPFGFQPMNFGGPAPAGVHVHGAPHGPAAVPNAGHNPGAGDQDHGQAQQSTPQQAGGESHGQAQPGEAEHGQQQPGLNVPHAPGRPLSEQGFHVEGIGPNGQRITIHQQTLQFPHMQIPGQHMPFGANMMPPQLPTMGLPPLPGMPPQQHGQPQRPSALDQARDNIAEMRRMLTELRDLNGEEHRAQIDRLEQRTQAVHSYIDPLSLHGAMPNRGPTRIGPTIGGYRLAHPNAGQPQNWQQRARQMRHTQQAANQGPIITDSNVTCYLLSSPNGPHALLYSPQHGTFTGQLPHHQSFATSDLQPTSTTTIAPAGAPQDQGNQQPGQANAAAQAPAQGQAAAAAANPLGPMEPIMGHAWLLLRILIFSYFLLGTNMGWQRPLALLAIAGGFWMIRLGLLGDGGALRRWWEGIVQEGQQQRAPAAQQPGAEGQAQPGQQANQDAAQPGQAARPAQMPTPAQVAQRLLDEEQRQRAANRDQRWQWLREQVRPAERALALLVASLWPGVGEAYVRAREQEARRVAEEEIAARRREEEERQRKEEEEKAKAEEKEKPEPIPDPATTADTAIGQQQDAFSGPAPVEAHE